MTNLPIKMASRELNLSLSVLLFMIFTLLLVPHTMHMRYSLLVDHDSSLALSIMFYLILGFNLFNALIGLYSTWSKSLVVARRFAGYLIGTEILLLICLIVEGTQFPGSRRDNLKLMKKFMPKYDWDYPECDSGTKAWNAAQGEMCCGINGYQDWDKFRPKNIASSLYPESCCPKPNAFSGDKGPYCADDSDLYRIGCAQLGESYLSKTLIFFSFYLAYQTVLVVFAFKDYLKIYKDNKDTPLQGIRSQVENGHSNSGN